MPVIFQDVFDYPDGTVTPFGSWIGYNGGNGIVQNSPGAGVNPSPNYSVQVGNIATQGPGILSGGTIFWGLKLSTQQSGAELAQVLNANPSNLNAAVALITLFLEDDRSVSIYGPDGILTDPVSHLPANTGSSENFFMGSDVWYFMSLAWGISGDPVAVGATVNILGGAYASAEGQQVTHLAPLALPFPSLDPMANLFTVGVPGPGGFIANYAFDGVEGASYPHPSPNNEILGRLSAVYGEPVELPSDAEGRLSSFGLELAELPSNADVRCSQFVIELISTGGSVNRYIFLHRRKRRFPKVHIVS